MQIEFDADEYLQNRIRLNVKTLFLQFLYMLEDLRDEGKISENEFQTKRKRVLDAGNDSTRQLLTELENFTFHFRLKQDHENKTET